jgi:hypothetical protein
LRRLRDCIDMAERIEGDDKRTLLDVADAWLRLARLALDEEIKGSPRTV